MFLLISGNENGAPIYGVSVQSSTKVSEMFQQITQKLWDTKT